MKFVGQPKHALDLGFLKRVGKKLDALLNSIICNPQGQPIGKILPADGNMVFQIDAGAWKWQTPYKELDSSKAVAKDTFVFVSEANPLAVDGLIDLDSGALVKARPGIWQAAQDVPAQVTVDAVVKYHVPTLPYPPAGPVGSVGSAGSMQGDLDQTVSSAPSVYWIYFGGYVSCSV